MTGDAERFAYGERRPRPARPVSLGERAQILRRCRYALATVPLSAPLLHDAADGDGAGWPRIRDSTPDGLSRLRVALVALGVPESLPRNAASPARERPRRTRVSDPPNGG